MSRPTVVEVNFHEFKRVLENAIATGSRITPGEAQRWRGYVAAHQVREVNFQAYARGKHENLEPVIIDAAAPWGGYYMWSPRDEVVLRWQPAGDDAKQAGDGNKN